MSKKQAVPEPGGKKGKKAKDEELPAFNRAEALARLRAEINHQFKGSGALLQGHEFSNVYMQRRPTSITSLDVALVGGFPAGGLCQIIGAEGVGKDYLCNLVIAGVQRAYGDDAAINLAMTEFKYDKQFAKKCGARIAYSVQEILDWQRALGRDFTPEELVWARDQVGSVDQGQFSNAEKLLEATALALESNLYHVIVINSIGALLTKAEEEAEQGIADKHYGGAAAVITAFMHRVHSAIMLPDAYGRPNRTTILVVNQVRDNVGPDAKWNPLKESGGHALKHGKLIDVWLKPSSKIQQQVTQTEKLQLGKEIKWELLKGKAGCHEGVKGEYNFYFGEYGRPFGCDFAEDLLNVATLLKIVQQAGAWYIWNGQRFQGKESFLTFLRVTPTVYVEIHQAVFSLSGIKFFEKED